MTEDVALEKRCFRKDIELLVSQLQLNVPYLYTAKVVPLIVPTLPTNLCIYALAKYRKMDMKGMKNMNFWDHRPFSGELP